MNNYNEELEAENVALRKQLAEEEGERWNLARRLEIVTLEAEKMSTLEANLAAKDAKIAALETDIEGLRIVAEGLVWAKKRNAELEAENVALRAALEEIAEGDGCNCRVGPGCDMKCKDIARAAIDAARKA